MRSIDTQSFATTFVKGGVRVRKAGLIRNNRRRTVSAVKTGREKWENTCENDMGTKRERITRNKGKREPTLYGRR